jgi:lipopolysaccharide biosynthesis regulator YciM
LSETAILAVLVAAAAGFLAGRVYLRARHHSLRDRPGFRTSPHYTLGIHYLASGQPALAMTELEKLAREDRDAVDVLQVLSHLRREAGQVERAIQIHQGLLARGDLTRAERAHAMASLGADFRTAGFVDRASRAFEEALAYDSNSIYALTNQRKLREDQRQWREAFELEHRLARLRKGEDRLVLGHLQAQIGVEAAQGGDPAAAEAAFKAALAIDARIVPAHLGLADLCLEEQPARAAALLEEGARRVPEQAYLFHSRLERCYEALGERERFVSMMERAIREEPHDWRARVALARHLRERARGDEAYGLLLRALEANPHVLAIHVEILRTLRALGTAPLVEPYAAAAERAIFYLDPHICVACRYRADTMLWRCPHCHEWGTFVEERVGPMATGS